NGMQLSRHNVKRHILQRHYAGKTFANAIDCDNGRHRLGMLRFTDKHDLQSASQILSAILTTFALRSNNRRTEKRCSVPRFSSTSSAKWLSRCADKSQASAIQHWRRETLPPRNLAQSASGGDAPADVQAAPKSGSAERKQKCR